MTDEDVDDFMQAMQQAEASIEAYGGHDRWEADGGAGVAELSVLVSQRKDDGTLTPKQADNAIDLLMKLKAILTPGID